MITPNRVPFCATDPAATAAPPRGAGQVDRRGQATRPGTVGEVG
jgi:hypothetical protein